MERLPVRSQFRAIGAVRVILLLGVGCHAAADQQKISDAWFFPDRPAGLKGIEGKPPPPLKLKSWIGEPVDVPGSKGKVVVIDFWATWCGPCVAELPHLKELYTRFKDSGLEIIGINLDEKAQTMIDFCAKKELDWPQYCEGKGWKSEFSQSWGINGIPTVFVVDKQGLLHSTEARGQLDAMVAQLLAAPNP